MTRLRHLSSRGLAALLVAIVAGATVLAVGATALAGNGRNQPSTDLATALHSALVAPPVQGVSADIKFTNNLIDSSSVGAHGNPLLTGATGRLWASNDGRLRLELQSNRGDAQIVVNQGTFSLYEASSNTVYRGALPQSEGKNEAGKPDAAKPHALPTVAEIQTKLNDLAKHVTLSGAIGGNTGGQPSYTVKLAPAHDGGLLGRVELAWDAATGAPLRAAVYAQGDGNPVLELAATQIKYGSVSPSVFSVSAPPGAKVVDVKVPSSTSGGAKDAKQAKAHKTDKAHATKAEVTGVSAVQAKLPFTLAAPDQLATMPRTNVRLLEMNGHPAALVTYGQHLGAIAVLERSADKGQTPSKPAPPAGSDPQGDGGGSLPSISVNGATGNELATALGTLISFKRGAVSYVVAGSVPSAAAEAAARGL